MKLYTTLLTSYLELDDNAGYFTYKPEEANGEKKE